MQSEILLQLYCARGCEGGEAAEEGNRYSSSVYNKKNNFN